MKTTYTVTLTVQELVAAEFALKMAVRQGMKFRSYNGKPRMEKRGFLRSDISALRQLRKAVVQYS